MSTKSQSQSRKACREPKHPFYKEVSPDPVLIPRTLGELYTNKEERDWIFNDGKARVPGSVESVINFVRGAICVEGKFLKTRIFNRADGFYCTASLAGGLVTITFRDENQFKIKEVDIPLPRFM